MILPIGNKILSGGAESPKDLPRADRCRRFQKLNRRGFSFIEIMVALVILGVGIAGIYRGFLQSLNYQQHLLTRLYIFNFLTDEFARDENDLLRGGQLPLGSLGDPGDVISGPGRFFAYREILSVDQFGPAKIEVLNLRVSWFQRDKIQIFSQSSFVYVEK